MPSDSFPASNQLKDWLNPARYRLLAKQLQQIEPRFDTATFLDLTLQGLDGRELKARLHQLVLGLDAALPGPFRKNLATLRKFAPTIEHTFIAVGLSDYVAAFGVDQPHLALPALKFFTRFGSAEFAIRPFIIRDQPATLAQMLKWATDPDEHVRRLASEGSRPRLPWGQQLRALVVDPRPAFPILRQLNTDPSLYVRKSVANHLNDIGKDNPELMLDLIETWDRSIPATKWIVQHGLRSLIKQGHPRALRICGVSPNPQIVISSFECTPPSLHLGEYLHLSVALMSQDSRQLELVIDYVVHYIKASGASSPKVFKWKNLTLAAGQKVAFAKRQIIRDFSTRKHHAGNHRIELQINGRRLAETAFDLNR